MTSAKIKRTKIMCIINDELNAVRGSLSENYLTRKFIARNIRDLWYNVFPRLLHVYTESDTVP